MQNKTELIKISVYVLGIKKRCRKPERHILGVIKNMSYDENLNLNDYKDQALEVLKRDMKSYNNKITLKSTVYSLDYSRGYKTTSIQIFDPRNKELVIELC